ncbi:MAG TPA: glycerate kinase [Streptosporangiaceae bacterium]|nr:glycerate kinase [Streptosporangiaceae bacterium]
MPDHGARVVVAPDKFKDSVTAAQAAAALRAGLLSERPFLDVLPLPVADGGEGTVDAAVSAGYQIVPVRADGPTGEPVDTCFAILDGTAVVELADVSGLRRLPGGGGGGKAPLTASTYGVGQVIAAALDGGATTIVLGIGGSSSTDGGAGMLQALGVRLTGADGADLERGGAALAGLVDIDPAGLDRRLRAGGGSTVLVASDVNNPLLGLSGAAAVFGPQKGAAPAQVEILDAALARFAAGTASVTGLDLASAAGAGAAGGTGFGALAYLGAKLVPGVDLVLDLIGFDDALAGAGLVITGEGSMDSQSLGGKAPIGVARAAARRAVPAVAVAGQVRLSAEDAAAAGFAAVYALTDLEPDQAASIARAEELLQQVGALIAASGLAG